MFAGRCYKFMIESGGKRGSDHAKLQILEHYTFPGRFSPRRRLHLFFPCCCASVSTIPILRAGWGRSGISPVLSMFSIATVMLTFYISEMYRTEVTISRLKQILRLLFALGLSLVLISFIFLLDSPLPGLASDQPLQRSSDGRLPAALALLVLQPRRSRPAEKESADSGRGSHGELSGFGNPGAAFVVCPGWIHRRRSRASGPGNRRNPRSGRYGQTLRHRQGKKRIDDHRQHPARPEGKGTAQPDGMQVQGPDYPGHALGLQGNLRQDSHSARG